MINVPSVQTYFAQTIANQFNKEYGTEVQIKTAELNYSGNINLNNLLIKDHKNDTLIYFNSLYLSPISLKKMMSNNFNFQSIVFSGLKLNIFKYFSEDKSNLEIFINKLTTEKNQTDIKFDLNFIIQDISGLNSNIVFKDFNTFENNFNFSDLNFDFSAVSFFKNKIEFDVNDISFKNNNGYDLKRFSSRVSFNENNLNLKNLVLNYGNSNLKGDLFFDLSRINISSLTKTETIDSIYVDFKFDNSDIFPSDFHSFYNKIDKNYSKSWSFKSDIRGFANDLYVENTVFSNNDNLIKFDSKLSNIFNKEKEYLLDFNFKNINTSSQTLLSIVPEFFGTIIPSSIKNLGKFKFNGSIIVNTNEINSKFNLSLKKGIVNGALSISELSNIDNAIYSGYIKGKDIDVSRFINFKAIGYSNFEFEISGRGFTSEFLNSTVTGKIDQISFNNLILNKLDVFGQVKNQVFDGKFTLNDPNLNLDFNGLINFSNDLIDFNFNSSINYANLFNLGFNDSSEIDGDIVVKLRGNNLKDLIGDLTLKKIRYINENGTFEFQDLNAQLRNNEGNRIININSEDILSGILIGEYDWLNIKSSVLNNFGSHYSNYDSLKPFTSQNISFNLNFKPKFLKLINNKLLIDENTFLKGNFESNGNYQINFESSFFRYKDINAINLNLALSNKSGLIKVDNINSRFINGKDFIISTNFVNDSLKVISSYKSIKNELNKVSFSHTINNKNKSIISFYDMELMINNQKWSLDTNTKKILPVLSFSRNKKDYSLLNANLKSNDQSLDINISEDSKNSFYSLNFKNVSLENLTSNKNKIFFQALVNGKVELIKNNDEYTGSSYLSLDNLKANNNLLGSANLNINSTNDLKSFIMSFNITNKSKKTLDLQGKFSIEEAFYPVDMKLIMRDFDIMPFSKLGDNVITNFKGFFDSKILISGNSETPILSGKIKTKGVEFLIPYLNVNYELINNPEFSLVNQTFNLNDFSLYNSKTKSIGKLNGKINHNKFEDWFIDLNINTDNLLILDTNPDMNPVYYGLGFLNGKANIIGPGENLFIDVKGSTNKGTSLTIPIKKSKNTGDLSYLNFINNNVDQNDIAYDTNGLKVNLDLQFNPAANIEVILDPESGSKLISKGTGNLNFKISTVGNFNIFGDYSVDSGSYFYKTLGIVDREFNLKKGSTIVWTGNPYMADLNINANYEIPGGANPAILIQNTSFNRKIPTNIDVNLSGNLIEMNTPVFNINFPNTSGPIKSEIEYYLVDEEKKQKQAISLLYQSTFINEISLYSLSSQAITNNLFQKASGIIDDIFTNSDDKMNVGINYLKGDKNAASTLLNKDRLGLTTKIEINDKILINGKIGVPVGGIEENVIIGDVQIEFLLNDKGNLKARFFNKENEYQYFANDIGYTQGMGISYELDFDSFKELFKNKKNSSTKITD